MFAGFSAAPRICRRIGTHRRSLRGLRQLYHATPNISDPAGPLRASGSISMAHPKDPGPSSQPGPPPSSRSSEAAPSEPPSPPSPSTRESSRDRQKFPGTSTLFPPLSLAESPIRHRSRSANRSNQHNEPAMARAVHIPGVIFLFFAFVLLFLVSISLPYLPALDFARVHFGGNLSANAPDGAIVNLRVSRFNVHS